MQDWTAGYVAEIDYTFGYYSELNPLRVALAFLNAGLAVPTQGTACELGFGQGVSTNIHAAAQAQVRQWGTDFNPGQAAHAQMLAEASGSGARLFDESFEQFCERSDLPDFDFICLHGIWSWISDDNRRIIVDFIRRKLKVGGVLYISYNTLPGWAAMMPMRHLLTQHADVMSAPGHGIVKRVDAALEFAEKLFATQPGYARANSGIEERFKSLKTQDKHYLAHEYFNRDWHPMHFATMGEWLAQAKLSFACSANFIEHVDEINLLPEHRALLRDIVDPMFRETARDMIVNQQFRKDYWVKGGRRLNSVERVEAMRKLRVVLIRARGDVSLKVKGAQGEGDMNAAAYNPVLDLLSDHAPRTLGEIEHALAGGLNFAQLLQIALILCGTGALAVAQDNVAIAKSKETCKRLNASLMERARGSGDIGYLASPVTGGGIGVGRVNQLFLLFIAQGKKNPQEWADLSWQVLSAQGSRLIKDGKELSSPEDNLIEMRAQADAFAASTLPILRKLGVAT
jgi:SAM-dependent methyltransferase